MKNSVGKLLAILTLVGLALAVSINTVSNGVFAQTIDEQEPIYEEPTATPIPTPTDSPSPTPTPTPQPTAGPSVFSFIMANFDILGLARLVLIALGILWVIVIVRALDKNFGRKKPKQQ